MVALGSQSVNEGNASVLEVVFTCELVPELLYV